MAKILWMDNDRTYLWPHVTRLKASGYEVVRVYCVSEAEKLLNDEDDWDLVIIDPMMNVGEKEEMDYPPSDTDSGLKAGVIFYKRTKSRIEEIGAKAVVFTLRDDQEIIQNFVKLKLPEQNIKYKMDASDTAEFLAWIEGFMGNREEMHVQ